eukprot:TRINITY_DN6639_c1_g1_i4.p1 TRINITY_DN6639_c1_g1~~TRINITY_DN6639_c1_g1_i4.p1  ORF type:complete len:501 (+),score=149.66 TRINITY_DN6639_c1_g1_i4:82-1584(+)
MNTTTLGIDDLKKSKKLRSNRLLIVSLNNPVSRNSLGELVYNTTKLAGITSAVTALQASGEINGYMFIGAENPSHKKDELSKLSCVSVPIPSDVMELYYQGYCKSSLWPLLHYRLQSVKHDSRWFEAYNTANSLFADAILAHCRPGDMVWIHDYHLMMLPAILRDKLPTDTSLGFFFHVPFVSSELFRILPNRTELLRGVLGADLIGFQAFEYIRHFHSTVSRLLGVDCTANGVETPSDIGHFVRVSVFPAGVDTDGFRRLLGLDSVQSRISQLRQTFKGYQVIIGKDRVDEIEGVPLKLQAFEMFLKQNPVWKGKVILLQLYEPPEPGKSQDDKIALQRVVNETVGRINGAYGSIDYVPVHYINKKLDIEEICAMFSIADVALITPMRDGMNLISHEFTACQPAPVAEDEENSSKDDNKSKEQQATTTTTTVDSTAPPPIHFPLKANKATQTKKYNIAKFHTPHNVSLDFKKMAQPGSVCFILHLPSPSPPSPSPPFPS